MQVVRVLPAWAVAIGLAAMARGGEGDPGGHEAAEGHAEHAMAAEKPESRRLLDTDMARMAGMTVHDPAGAVPVPRWSWSGLVIARAVANDQGGPSGDRAFESSNWAMVMGHRDVGGGRVTLMAMGSLEPATVPREGSPQLFQTGETFEGKPLVDRQHPHDLLMNLSATYRRAVGDDVAWWLHAAVRGEPALGPTAFMHRASAGENPAAPLGHHQQDATHITDDVVTAGLGWQRIALEASAFHGEEPDEERWDVDPGALDSYSARIQADLGGRFALQVSRGFLEEPEALEEGDQTRTSASLSYGERGDGPFAGIVVWGHNREEHGSFGAVLLEAAYQATARDQIYGRAEQVDKPEDLLRTKGLGKDDEQEHGNATVRALTLGYFRSFPLLGKRKDVETGAGVDVTAYAFPSELEPTYGESPVSWHAFLRVRFQRGHGAHAGEHHGGEP